MCQTSPTDAFGLYVAIVVDMVLPIVVQPWEMDGHQTIKSGMMHCKMWPWS